MACRRRAGLTALLLATALVSCGLVPSAPSDPTPSASPTQQSGTSTSDYDPTPEDFSAIEQAMRVRARAVRDGDRDAFLSIVDTSDPDFVESEGVLFDNLSKLPVSHYSLHADEVYLTPATLSDAPDRLAPQTVEEVQITGVDSRPAAYPVRLTWVKRGDQWLLGAEGSRTSATRSRPADSRPWLGGPVVVRTEGGTIAVVDADQEEQAKPLLDAVRRGIRADAQVLEMRPVYDVLVDATSNGEVTKMNSLDDQEAAAVTFSVLSRGTDSRPARLAGTRIQANPDHVGYLLDDSEVLRHELVHFLTVHDGPQPRWVSEGLAVYVSNAPHTPRDAVYPTSTYDDVMSIAKLGPPVSGSFGLDPQADYLLAWCAVTDLVERKDITTFRSFSRAFEPEPGRPYPDLQVPDLLERFYGITAEELGRGTAEVCGAVQHG